MSATITLDTLSQPCVVGLLHSAFGPARSWSDYLADSIRGKGSFFRLRLLPDCYLPGSTGRSKRPLYSRESVREFITEAVKRGAQPAARFRYELIRVELDADALLLPPASRRARLVDTTPRRH